MTLLCRSLPPLFPRGLSYPRCAYQLWAALVPAIASHRELTSRTRAHAHTRAYTHAHAQRRARNDARTRTGTNAYAHTQTHTYAHTQAHNGCVTQHCCNDNTTQRQTTQRKVEPPSSMARKARTRQSCSPPVMETPAARLHNTSAPSPIAPLTTTTTACIHTYRITLCGARLLHRHIYIYIYISV